jgi:protein-tyrosine phosphatase
MSPVVDRILPALERLRPLVEAGALVQVTAASVDGRLGTASRRCAATLLELGLAHMLASDAHSPDLRAVGLDAAARRVADAELARWLTVDVPRAVLDDAEPPPRPASR